MKAFLILLLLLIFASCSFGPIQKDPSQPDPVVVESAPVAIEVLKPIEVVTPKEEWKVQIKVSSLTGFTKQQEERFNKIAKNLEEIINSKEFKDAVLNHSYEGKKTFVDNEEKTNEQILQKILSQDWVLEYRLEYIAKKPFVPLTVGYTYPSVSWIVINSKIFNTMGDEEIAANITHEYGGHKLGRFSHSQKWNKARPFSVPYGIGKIVEQQYVKKFKK